MTAPSAPTLDRADPLRSARQSTPSGEPVTGPNQIWKGSFPCWGAMLSSRLRNALFVLFIGGILAYGAGFAWYMLARFDLVNLIRDVNGDDSFYYFQIARNLAEGKFSTFDGGITRTNGYHPLWMFLITPFYWIFDKEAALFGIKAFEIMLVAGGVALVAAAARVARLPWVLMFAALPMLYHHHALFGGMEAAAALFMLGLFILTACLFARSPARWRWPLAAVAFALPWVRMEYIAISLAATAALCLIEWSRRESPPPVPSGEMGRASAPGSGGLAHSVLATNTAAPLLGAVAGILAYFAYNGIVFGGVTPVSGATKHMWSQWLWEREGGYGFVQNFRDVLRIPAFDYELLVALEVCAYVVLVWWLARRSGGGWTNRLLLAFLVCVFGLAVGHLAKFAQTVLTVHPHWGGDSWYFVPAYLLMTLVIPARCYAAIHFTRCFIGPRWPQAADVLSVGIVVVGAVFLLAKADFTGPFRDVDRKSESTRQRLGDATYMGVRVVDRVLPDDSVVGSWDAGVIGYFSRFPVVNLDGLVNSYDYMRARKEGTEAAFYPRYGITHFVNMGRKESAVLQRLERPSGGGATLFEGSSYRHHGGKKVGPFKLLSTEPPEMSSGGANRYDWFWQRMAPYFDHHQSDGVGLIVDGRMAQAFVRDCAPDELAVWSWTSRGEETAVGPWTRTQTGLCVDARVLPRNALPPVRVETMTVGDWVSGPLGGGRPIIRSDWDVYLVEDSLVYAKAQCGPEDAEPTFFLHLGPGDVNDLPSHRKQHGFDNLDFHFRAHRLLIEEQVCVAAQELPDYGIAAVRTGQSTGEGQKIWEGHFNVAGPPGKADSAAWILQRMEPHFDYQTDDAGLLVDGRLVQTFARECDPDELVVWSWAGDGTVAKAWTRTHTGWCAAAAVLPPTMRSPVRFETMSATDYLTRLTGGGPPVIRSDWDVYLFDGSLVYAKRQCSPEDVEPTFFLHLDPGDVNDLPSHRKQYGFDNLDFAFRNHRHPVGGEICVAIRELPDYGIAAIRTGQSTREGKKIWEGKGRHEWAGGGSPTSRP